MLQSGKFTNRQPSLQGCLAARQARDTEEGADETDEGGGKRLLRSHTAAAAADLDRENSVGGTTRPG